MGLNRHFLMIENGMCQIALHIVSLCIMFQCTHIYEITSTEEMRGQKAMSQD